MTSALSERKRYGNGLVMGKFMPLHLGHEYLIDTALANCERLTIFVYSLPGQPIDGETRTGWVRERFPEARVIHVVDFEPVYQESDPRFWSMWAEQIRSNHKGQIDAIFSSEDYGERLARELGAEHVCVDRARAVYGVSGTEIRNDPTGKLAFVSPAARAYVLSSLRKD
ncbi:MAG: adenylyltransferase/cytidyltransferase family protein [Candidatus Micrarchaeota archaeon]|nr:adenylyltransferase/cytidyltransferase family protein [Candidatus Micrarchaeota archaeon]